MWGGGAAFAGAALALYGSVAGLSVHCERVEATAHRGYSRAAPENTLSAFRKAVEVGADYAELDVQRTADSALVILHDSDLMRLTKTSKGIHELTLAEVRRFDVGSHFDPAFAGERIPTLAEVIALARGKIKLNIELKFHGKDRRLAADVACLLREEDFEDQCVVTSLNYDGLVEVKRHNPRLQTGVIVAVALGESAGWTWTCSVWTRSSVPSGCCARRGGTASRCTSGQ